VDELECGLPHGPNAAGARTQRRSGERARVAKHEVRAAAARAELETAKTALGSVQSKHKDLEPRLSFSPKLPTSVPDVDPGPTPEKAGERALA